MRMECFSSDEIKRIRTQIPVVKDALLGNTDCVPRLHARLLTTSASDPTIWLTHNQDNILLADFAPELAWNNIRAFMRFQRTDGLFPCRLPRMEGVEQDALPLFNHVCGVFPFAQCALLIAKKARKSLEDLRQIYQAASSFDLWLMRNRNRTQTGLVELYCSADTGIPDSPRAKDGEIPVVCPNGDAATMPELACMPILSVELSSMLYGGRIALSIIAQLLNLPEEAQCWTEKAKQVRDGINQWLMDSADHFYYDRSPQGLRKYKTEHITSLFLNRVLTQEQFDQIYDRHFTIPAAGFLPDYPIPAMAVDDPHGDDSLLPLPAYLASHSLTALRTLFWMDFYGRAHDQQALLSIWLKSFVQHDFIFTKTINPFNGEPIGKQEYDSAAMLLFLEATRHLHLV